MIVWHTSPHPVEQVVDGGEFGPRLFFALQPYSPRWFGQPSFLYALEIDEGAVLRASRIFYEDPDDGTLDTVIEAAVHESGLDEATVRDLIDGTVNSFDVIDDTDEAAEIGWAAQRWAAEAAETLGYRGVALQDEQGTAYLMRVSADELVLVDEADWREVERRGLGRLAVAPSQRKGGASPFHEVGRKRRPSR